MSPDELASSGIEQAFLSVSRQGFSATQVQAIEQFRLAL
jgi:hypothetical protein